MSKESPILFNTPMVRALLDGSKTQTRRIMKPQPEPVPHHSGDCQWRCNASQSMVSVSDTRAPDTDGMAGDACPHGGHGDHLRVRETYFAYGRWVTRYSQKKGRDEWHFIDMTAECARAYQYDADSPEVLLAAGRGGALPGWYMRPSIFMPRAACRILLEIVSVRVERLQDISDADIVAEGIDMEALTESQDRYDIVCKGTGASGRATERSAWRDLWESTGGDWDSNPWLWVIEFKRVTP
ncbi:hypothetical protein [Janthinobacterium sp. NKUCC06_STL]|uniref:hypothetical protein n=1 Tax=Janthinobacterium sp. NKUCC06_STL TaxID=2842127 RepID=UPI001C5A863A|nr:hypothetical protein [Janthinobacterium sp. NKUCC06_STL]MBW3512887.1 hypothetical protein [Janthinobacterium sp. NKUCC06_STL]